MRSNRDYMPLVLPLLLAACRTHGAATPSAPATAAAGPSPTTNATDENARPAEWGYEGRLGPASWAQLNPAYAACSASKRESPIDLPASASGGGKPWTLNYKATSLQIAHHEHVTDILDNGHTIQVTVQEGSTLDTDKGSYQLKQFHFHTPSEHTVDGKSFPMEAHFVHQAAGGAFAVVAVLFSEGAPNPNLAKLIAHFPQRHGEARFEPDVELDLSLHVPSDGTAHHYSGSFTTPPCTDGVEWLVFRTPVTASAEQLQAFATRLNHNNRPVQPRNDRAVVVDKVAGSTPP